MKKIWVMACLLMGLAASAQKTDMQQLSEQIRNSTAAAREQRIKSDSLSKSINEMISRRYDSMQQAQIERDAKRNGEMILRLHNEHQAKQKRKMFIYLGMGIFFLAVLVVGLMRKRKQKK